MVGRIPTFRKLVGFCQRNGIERFGLCCGGDNPDTRDDSWDNSVITDSSGVVRRIPAGWQ